MGHSYDFYSYFQALNIITPFMISVFTLLFWVFLIIFVLCSLFKCCNYDGTGYKVFRAIAVAGARGLFGAAAIKRRDYRDPPCVKVYGKLYEANIFVLAALLYYTLAVVIVVVLVSIGFSVHVSYGLDECSSKVDCFHVDISDGVVNVTTIVNCSLPADVDTADDVQCYAFLQFAVIIALIGGYITLVPPLFLSIITAIHTFIFESCLKYDIQNKRKNYCISITFSSIISFLPILHFLLVILKENENEFDNDNNVVKFILKDTILGQVIAALVTLIAFLAYPWFMLGRYRQYTEGEEAEKEEVCKKPHICKRMCCCCCIQAEDDSLLLKHNVYDHEAINMTKELIEKH